MFAKTLAAMALLASVMTWDPSPSPDAANCYHIVTQQRPPMQATPLWKIYDGFYIKRYTTDVCGPPYVWTLPPDPPPGWLQYFCIQTRDTSNLFSVCAEIEFVK